MIVNKAVTERKKIIKLTYGTIKSYNECPLLQQIFTKNK